MLKAIMKHCLGILVIDAHHIVDVIFHRIGAGAFMKNSVHVSAVKVVFLDAFQKIVLVPIIKEFQST